MNEARKQKPRAPSLDEHQSTDTPANTDHIGNCYNYLMVVVVVLVIVVMRCMAA